MKFFETACEIAAPPVKVWGVLTDSRRLVNGGLGLTRLDGTIEATAHLVLWSEVSPNRAFRLRVTRFEPPRTLVWCGGMPLGLFKGERTFALTATAAGTHFHMREQYSGLMLPLIWGSMPDLNPSFRTFATGLKRLAES